MELSLKLLMNKQYEVLPVFKDKVSLKTHRRPDDLIGIRLLHSKSKTPVWPQNSGVIGMRNLTEESRQYVINKFTDMSHLKIFGGLGD